MLFKGFLQAFSSGMWWFSGILWWFYGILVGKSVVRHCGENPEAIGKMVCPHSAPVFYSEAFVSLGHLTLGLPVYQTTGVAVDTSMTSMTNRFKIGF